MQVYIVAGSDVELDAERKLRWGDHWFKEGLGRALERQGHTPTEDVREADVLVNCRGFAVERLPEWTWNILWIIGHPDTVTAAECQQYDAVFCESARFTEHLQQQGVACRHLPGASDMTPLEGPREHEAVFVGNWREGRVLDPQGMALEVWGEGWDGHLPEGAVWRGPYYPNERLGWLYATSALVLNDTHADMARWGFRNPRHYDILAVRGDRVPTFGECAGALMAGARPIVGLDLGCGATPRPHMTGVDLQAGERVIAHDLERGLPGLGPYDVIVADNLLEHINNLIPLLNDCHVALRDGGRMHIRVPNARDPVAAFADPTHVRCFVPDTFDYFNVEHPRWREYGRGYGIAPWRVVACREAGRFVDVMLRPAREASDG